MKHHPILLLLCLLVCLSVVLPLPSQAQSTSEPARIVINYATLNPSNDRQADKGALEVFFTVMDAQGQPIIRPDIDTAHVRFVDFDDELALVDDPDAPIYIALLVDVSGSMARSMDGVRQAAIQSIRASPRNAHFAVYAFSRDRKSMLPDDLFFSADTRQVEQAIRGITVVPGGETCLYDSIIDTIRDVRRDAPERESRRAVIAFTDGVDELRDDAGPCSRNKLPDVITEAQGITGRDAVAIPVYTIGLCNPGPRDPCVYTEPIEFQGETVEANSIQFLAEYTNAMMAKGNLNDIHHAFNAIMQALNSQWLARANVFATRGSNQAILDVTFKDGSSLQSATFDFVSETDYIPLPMVRIVRTMFVDDQYVLEPDLTRPSDMSEITVGILDKQTGSELPEQIFTQSDIQDYLAQQKPFVINTSSLRAEQEYCFRVRARDRNRNPLLRQGVMGEPDHNLDEKCVVYSPGIPFQISNVLQNTRNSTLVINLALQESGGQPLLYEVSILDDGTNQPVDDDPPPQGLLTGSQIEMPIPQKIMQAREERAYRVGVTLKRAGQEHGAQATYPARFKSPGMFGRLLMIIVNPFVLGGLLVIAVGVAAWIAYSRLRASKQKPPARPPIYNPPTILPGSRGLVIRITQTPDKTQKREISLERSDKPFVIGRGSTADLCITGDRDISREHAQISIKDYLFTLSDLGSRNGTFVDDQDRRLEPKEVIPLVRPVVVKLGKHTCLEIEPARLSSRSGSLDG